MTACSQTENCNAFRLTASTLTNCSHKPVKTDLASAELLVDANPKRAYESVYDASRMALTAVLENEGLRPTSRGGTSRRTQRSQPSLTRLWARYSGRSTACGERGTGLSTLHLPRRTSRPTMSAQTFQQLRRSLRYARESSIKCRHFRRRQARLTG